MNWSVDFSPIVPVPVFWAAAALATILVGIMMFRRQRGAPFRALALATLLTALANPTLREEQRESLANVAIVVLDESSSQQLSTRPEQMAAVKADLEAKLAKVSNLNVKFVSAGKPGEAAQPGTNLFTSLNAALADTPPDRLAGVIMITDGQVHDVPKAAASLGFDAPVHALLTGQPDEFDRRVEIIKAPRYGIVGQTREIEVAIRESGKAGRATDTAKLTVRREGKPDEVRSAKVGGTVKLDMPFPHSGTNILEIELETAPGELTPVNNRVVVEAEGVRENLRVLLVSGEPHAGERTWRNLLKSDAAVDLVHFTILRPPEKQDGTPNKQLSLIAFPTRELFSEKINEFDLIIFDRYQHHGILQMLYYDNISRYVEQGGALLVAAGPSYPGAYRLYDTPLGGVLPGRATGEMVDGKFVPELTALGKRHSVTATLSTEGWGPWMRYMKMESGNAEALMQTPDGHPLLLLKRVGKGRVASVMSDQLWLWARGYDGGGPYAELIRRTAHWLMKEPELEEELLKLEAGAAPEIKARLQTMSDTPGKLELTGPDGKTVESDWSMTSPGHYQATLPANGLGLYRAKSGKLSAVTLRGPTHPREYLDLRATADKIQPLATATLGGVYKLGADGTPNLPRMQRVDERGNASGSDWFGLRKRNAYAVRATESTTLLPGVIGMLLACAFLMLAWRREGR